VASSRWTRESVARVAVGVLVFAIGSGGIFAFAAPFGPGDAAYGGTILVRALGCALIGIAAGTLAALACIDRDRTGAGLFLALASVVVGIVGLSVAFPDHRFLAMTVLTIYAAPFAIGYLIATSIGEVAPAGPDEPGRR
jgi:hypothetical protein